MTNGSEGPREDTARSRMEALIARMRRPAPEPASTEADEERLAAVAWRAANLPAPESGDGEEPEPQDAPTPLERGATVGRYMVLSTLGAGGMGVVYAAYDPELDRKVALKLVAPGRGGQDGSMRLLREAQALAKLSHRNVVAIHDVGTMGEQVWLAMELVRGVTLRQWCEPRRPWRDVLAVMRKAARGLAAAHAAGLLHRDFKPENVMVGKKGGVKVMDFGLARARPSAATPEPDESMPAAVPSLGTLAMRVTQAGTLLGTPLYMAPEQLLGREPTPAVDQFSLCVTMWEALYGERPFAGRRLDEIIAAVIEGTVREPPRSRPAPSWLRRVCARGLCRDPRQRFESMDALLDALAHGHTRARVRRGVTAVGVLALVGLGIEAHRRLELERRTAACEASGTAVEAAWSPARKQALHDAIHATSLSYAPTTAEKVMPWLDRQAEAWREARVEACLDAEVRERWDAATLERSSWCLDERLDQLASLVDELEQADAEVVQKAVQAAAGLSSVGPCRDARVLEALPSPPVDDRDDVRAVRAEVTHAGNLVWTGRYRKGLEVARHALARAEALGSRPLSAAARLQLGTLLARTGPTPEAETTLEDAYFEASEGVAPEVVASAAAKLVVVVGVSGARRDEGRRWGRHAEAALASVVDGRPLRRASLLGNLAILHRVGGDYERAKVLGEEELAILEEALGSEHPSLVASLMTLANVHYDAGDYEQSRALYERAIAILEGNLGPEHPTLALSLAGLAAAKRALGAPEEAKALHERAIAIQRTALGPEHPELATSLNNLANVLKDVGAYSEAKVLHEQAIAIRTKVLGAEHPDVARSLTGLAVVHDAMGAYAEAKALHERALLIREKTLGSAHPDVAASLANIASVLDSMGLWDESAQFYERAVAVSEKALGSDHPTVALILHNLGLLRRKTGAYDEAKALHQRALGLLEQAFGPEHANVARTVAGLAAVHRDTGAYAEAGALYERALEIAERALGPAHPDLASMLTSLAQVRMASGAYDEAKRLNERALSIVEGALGSDNPRLLYALAGLAEVALVQGRSGEAVALARRALVLGEQGEAVSVDLALTRFVLARALWDAPHDTGRDRSQALALAAQARDALREAGKGELRELAEVERWLAER